jgi:CheY-like chemotaxis protein
MKRSAPTILIVDDDEGHAILVRENLAAGGLNNPVMHFRDGQAVLDFFFKPVPGNGAESGRVYLILLDIRMPKIDGIEVLRRLKLDPEFRKLPIIMLTTTDDLREVERCHQLGCSVYIQKPIDYDKFAEAIRRLGMFMTLLLVPPVNSP